MIRLIFVAVVLAACTPAPRPIDPETGQPVPSNLNFAYCEKIALETRKSGGTNYNLCPGYMPDGYWNEFEG
ncbi:MAG: hypothetical protein KUG74_16210 [Rhodobacteraceae bacterium]|nr:hypothetical protein [Paracoccaceae bacterium]